MPREFAVPEPAKSVDSTGRHAHTELPCDRHRAGEEMPTFRAPAQLSRAAPITCPECGGQARLIRMSPDGFTRGKKENWTYECSACGHMIEKSVEARGQPG